MIEDQIKNILLKKVRRVNLSMDEQRQLDDWLSVSDDNKAILSQILDERQLAAELMILQNISTDTIWEKLRDDLQLQGAMVTSINNKPRMRRYWMYAAAAAVLLA